METYDDTDRPHHPDCPADTDEGGPCQCLDLSERDYDAAMDARLEADRDRC